METFSTLLALCVGNSPHKGQWRGALMFSLIYAWTNGWIHIWNAGELRRHRAQYDQCNVHVGEHSTSSPVVCSVTKTQKHHISGPLWRNPPLTVRPCHYIIMHCKQCCSSKISCWSQYLSCIITTRTFSPNILTTGYERLCMFKLFVLPVQLQLMSVMLILSPGLWNIIFNWFMHVLYPYSFLLKYSCIIINCPFCAKYFVLPYWIPEVWTFSDNAIYFFIYIY